MTLSNVVLPDYAGGSIANLMASLAAVLGGAQAACPPLPLPLHAQLRPGVVVLIVADGLGDAFLRTELPDGALGSHRVATLTSVFPSTTASAITTFLTGLTPATHGLTGWHIYARSIDRVIAALPFQLRGSDATPSELGLTAAAAFTAAPIFDRLPVAAHVVSPARIVDSPYNTLHSGTAQRHAYRTLTEFFEAIERCTRTCGQSGFVYAYWPDLDGVAHEHGIGARQTAGLLRRFDEGFARLLTALRGRAATVVVTGDHGLIDAPHEAAIVLDDHPGLAQMLAQPLSGERRAAYCHVRDDCRARFEDYVRTRFGDRVDLYESARLIEAGWFGPGPRHPELAFRVGDYVLLGRDGVTVKDWLPGEKRYRQIAVHGGLSAQEMQVPLIVVRP